LVIFIRQLFRLEKDQWLAHICRMNKAVSLLLGIWLMGYPVAAVILLIGGNYGWLNRHPTIGVVTGICWLGPLVTFGWIESRQRKLASNDSQAPKGSYNH
jgi:hypothetical protein